MPTTAWLHVQPLNATWTRLQLVAAWGKRSPDLTGKQIFYFRASVGARGIFEKTSKWWCLSLQVLAAGGRPRARQLSTPQDATWATAGTLREPVPETAEETAGSFMGAVGICPLPPRASQQPRAKSSVKINLSQLKSKVNLRRSPAAYTCASEVIATLRSLLAQARLKSCYTGWGAAILWNPQRRKSLKGEKAKGCLGQTTDCRHRQPAVASRLHPSGQ